MREALNMVKTSTLPRSPVQILNRSAKAELALREDETPVGCVFVYKGRIVARGMNDTNKTLNVGYSHG